MSFDSALQLVHQTLAQLHERGATLHASREALDALLAAAAAPPPPASEAPPAAASHAPAQLFASPARVVPPASAAPAAPRLSPEEKIARLAELRPGILACQRCEHLVRSRTQVVFGVGNAAAELMFVGEAPGEDEDLQGEPFVGKAGQLLTRIIEAMNLTRADVYIANVLKCRPDMPPGESGNRKPRAAEMQTCLPYLRQQIDIIQPRVLVALGATAMEGLLGETTPMNRLRGRWHEFNGIPLMATYHPAFLLRNQSLAEKRKVWEDLLMVLERLGHPISEKQRNFFLPK